MKFNTFIAVIVVCLSTLLTLACGESLEDVRKDNQQLEHERQLSYGELVVKFSQAKLSLAMGFMEESDVDKLEEELFDAGLFLDASMKQSLQLKALEENSNDDNPGLALGWVIAFPDHREAKKIAEQELKELLKGESTYFAKVLVENVKGLPTDSLRKYARARRAHLLAQAKKNPHKSTDKMWEYLRLRPKYLPDVGPEANTEMYQVVARYLVRHGETKQTAQILRGSMIEFGEDFFEKVFDGLDLPASVRTNLVEDYHTP